MMQGDSYTLGFRLKNNSGSLITPLDVADVEITLNGKSKTYKAGQVVYGNSLWGYPVSQTDTFAGEPGDVRAEIRIKWNNGTLEGKPVYGVRLNESMSKEVI